MAKLTLDGYEKYRAGKTRGAASLKAYVKSAMPNATQEERNAEIARLDAERGTSTRKRAAAAPKAKRQQAAQPARKRTPRTSADVLALSNDEKGFIASHRSLIADAHFRAFVINFAALPPDAQENIARYADEYSAAARIEAERERLNRERSEIERRLAELAERAASVTLPAALGTSSAGTVAAPAEPDSDAAPVARVGKRRKSKS